VTQAIGQRFHHMRRKMRCLLNEKVKPAAVDLRQSGGSLRHSVGRARTIVNQGHLTNERTWTGSFEHKITKENVDFTFQQHVHLVAFIAFPKKELAKSKLQRVGFLMKKVSRIHEGRDYKR
jgi:hypothetical protein